MQHNYYCNSKWTLRDPETKDKESIYGFWISQCQLRTAGVVVALHHLSIPLNYVVFPKHCDHDAYIYVSQLLCPRTPYDPL